MRVGFAIFADGDTMYYKELNSLAVDLLSG